MATTKTGVYRKYHGRIPTDSSGEPVPKAEWPKRRRHSWVVRWFGLDGRRYSRSFKTRKEAKLFAEEKQSEVRGGEPDPPDDLTLEEFGKMYLALRADLTDRTRQEHARTLKCLKERIGPGRLVRKITPIDARRFVSWYRRRKVGGRCISPATANKVLRECRRIFREAVNCRFIRGNPFGGIRQEKVGEKLWRHVPPEEYRRLIEASPSLRWKGMISLAYCCGLRLSAILNLTWRDIDFEARTLRVARKRGENGTEDWAPKDKDARVVPLPAEPLGILRQMRTATQNGQPYVFVHDKGRAKGRRVMRNNVWRDFQVIRRRAVVADCSMHALRKSCCTNLAESMPMHFVQEIAGHSDIRTTRRYYVKVRPELFDRARETVDALVAG